VIVYEAFPGEALSRFRRGSLDVLAHWLPLPQPDLTIGPVRPGSARARKAWSGRASARSSPPV